MCCRMQDFHQAHFRDQEIISDLRARLSHAEQRIRYLSAKIEKID